MCDIFPLCREAARSASAVLAVHPDFSIFCKPYHFDSDEGFACTGLYACRVLIALLTKARQHHKTTCIILL